ncbi:Sec-independent protein translocase subunit TatA/TatB [Collinsella aerofaciens]|uniref:Sec-independent protein translocase subunit TatA/TatB n=1 Tax=Collinsella aerofaciens TaxID=74426 RepID=UPI00232B0F39|nr:twin-arginine translocase TatA/TatE family subunit [Collinsella aerofaciens]MDB1818228.1 twin-arginine translocase TatA/TatE family subunit [Collinsella aerofaciens]MDB1821942.1 twin-arginine translocase TatA/TatE family subunit [Collinsella aerofaciens]MDB1824220.1 twin-arginine translocase TatA/TatE family subunit [Collinsella aerofaciens]MDB1825712.1 twin-arginine translocase TatA/TatE family subunit [Collinsella aerofaciens]MDC0805980.1 twin-arginine translocase TatA/TatE family subunit
MFGIGEGELAIIVVFGFLLFGPDKLPQMGRTIGRAIRQFRETQEKMTAVVQSEIIDPVSEAASAPVKPKKAAAADDDSDADEDATETAAPAKKETFAERRARLAAEKAASEGAAEGEVAAEGAAVEVATADADAAAADPEPAAEPKPEPAEPTTADLYARRPRKRKAVVDQLARELEVEDDAEAAAADAPKGGDE